ncbi:MAG: NAD-dependent epimerase/dehydratase family protein [Burkholderiales bacterium]
MRFTILGAGGFIGSALAQYLREQGHECHTPARTVSPPNGSASPALGHVLYCIGLTADFRNRPFDTARAHVGDLIPWLEHGTFESFLYLSSTRIYSRAAATHEDGTIIACPGDPDDLYNLTKAAGESVCLALQDPRIRVARLSSVVGERGNTHDFLNALLEEGARNGKVILRSHWECAKDYIRLEDVTKVLPKIAAFGSHRIYNVASGMNLANASVCAAISEVTGWEIRLQPNAPIVRSLPVDIGRARQEFGFSPAEVLPAIRALAKRHASAATTSHAP